jgi:predicted extracellular nuclease
MRRRLSLLLLLVFSSLILAQQPEKRNFKVMCYNVENYFDVVDDSLTNDQEFLPNGLRGWTTAKYQQKQANIAKVITAIGGWEAPALVGLCEIESRKGLVDLTRYSGLKNLKYKFLHHESPDARGVDVALLYQPNQFKPIHDEAIGIHFPGSPHSKTRDILFVSGLVPSGDTLHLFVCHFPSRLGGALESEGKRVYVASVLRAKVDSILKATPHPNIIIMGDFNDYPVNKSINETLAAQDPSTDSILPDTLYNLMYRLHKNGKGTNKHNGEWGALDQLIVSGELLETNQRFYTQDRDAHIFEADFLLENDPQFLGKQPFRTYVGMKYHHGFSDHLPIYADFWYSLKP